MTSVRGRTRDADSAADIGETLGVEEEYHLVDPLTWQLAGRPNLLAQVADDSHLQPEMRTSQLEIATDICHTLADVRTALARARLEAARVAASAGAAILAAGTHPSAPRNSVASCRAGPYWGVPPRASESGLGGWPKCADRDSAPRRIRHRIGSRALAALGISRRDSWSFYSHSARSGPRVHPRLFSSTWNVPNVGYLTLHGSVHRPKL